MTSVRVDVAHILSRAAAQNADAVAVVDLTGSRRREVTVGALHEGARRMAAALGGHGLVPGDRVGLCASNSSTFVQAWFAVLYAGCTVVPLPVTLPTSALRERLVHTRCGLLLLDAARAEVVAAEGGVGVPVVALSALTAADPSASLGPLVHPEGAPAMILATSGTTGLPRGVAIGHAALVAHTDALAQSTLRLGLGDRILGVLPLTHSYGCRMVMLMAIQTGATAVLLGRFQAEDVLETLRREAITWAPLVPTMVAAMAALPPGPPVASLRWCLSAGAPLADAYALAAEARLGAEVRQGYGMTEATFCTVNAPPSRRVHGRVGHPVDGVSIRVVGAQGETVAPGQVGEVWVRGPNLMDGYLDDVAATEAVIVDGWIRSGDLGCVHPEGDLEIVDRVRDLVLKGGHSVPPSSVERALASHPGVQEVAVVGRQDPYYGEEVVAVVVPSGQAPSIASLMAWQRERLDRAHLAREFAFVESLPIGPSGKVLKRSLRSDLASGVLDLVPADDRRAANH